MARQARLQWVHRHLQENRHPSAGDISRALRISRRQVYDDIHYMKYVLGAPIKYNRKFRGYRYTSRFEFPMLFDDGIHSDGLARLSGNLARLFSMFSKAFNDRTVLRVTLDNGTNHLFSCYGLFVDALVAFGFLGSRQDPEFIEINRVTAAGFSRSEFRDEIVLGTRSRFTKDRALKGHALLNGDDTSFFYWSVFDVIDWLSGNDVHILGSQKLVEELKMLSGKINRSLEANNR